MIDVLADARKLFSFDEKEVACPYPTLTGLRGHAPVIWFDEIESFVVTSHDLIVEVLRQPDKFSSRSATGRMTDREMTQLMVDLVTEEPEMATLAAELASSASAAVLLQADLPDHPRQRALVSRAFSPAVVRGMEPDIESLAHQLIDRFVDRGQVELLTEFSVPLPMTVIAKALGVSLDRMDDFMRWSKTLVAGIGTRGFGKDQIRDILQVRAALTKYLTTVIIEREEHPQQDLISQIVHAEIDGERLTHAEVISMVVQFLLAGNDTTAKLIASAMLRLATDKALAELLRADPEMVGPFVEEALRIGPPVNGTYRIADVDYELGGVTIPADSALWMVYAAGNRDPIQFEDPDQFKCPQPSKAPHLSFGFGSHFCLGASLARAEARIAIQALLARCDDINLDTDIDDIAYDQSFMLHGLKSLPLAFKAR